MAMARLYADEDFDRHVVLELRSLGHDVLTVQDAGQANQRTTDEQILRFATADGRAVVTFNRRDFIALHKSAQPHAGIIVCTRDPDAKALAGRINAAIQSCPTLDNQLLRVTKPAQASP